MTLLIAATSLPDVPLKSAILYVAAAYIGIWVIFFIYLLSLAGKLSGLRRQVEALTEEVERKKK